ncbi:MAG: OPT/YSL family transporter [Candidatus Obscuribacterales bacterium]|nr:OPT/YSL family transporter [Candidatus Obscuribacterales bacterium]
METTNSAPEEAHLSGDLHELNEREWFDKVYQGDKVPQLTLRAVLMGGLLGALMSISNLYTMLKVGWAFGVAITACVLSFVIWKVVRLFAPKLSDMTILENNCMQSTASAAGYSTGATVGIAFGALLLITGKHVDWTILFPWTLVSALLGVVLAVPMKRQMINREKLPFPSGIAAAQTLKSLHSHSAEAVKQAYSLVAAMFIAGITGFMKNGEFAWQLAMKLKLPELIHFPIKHRGIDMAALPGFGLEPSLLLAAAGMLVGLRVSLSMILSALFLYFIVSPELLQAGIISKPSDLIKGWALWTGSAIMVTSGLTAFAIEWKTIVRSFTGLKSDKQEGESDPLAAIEVPNSWLIIGVVPLALASVILQYVAFSINPLVGFTTVGLSFLLALVACRATGETDVTPMSAMCKITQLTVAVLAPRNITTNLMAASVTANIASSSADLLTDLKSGYLLGANPRKQFLAQLIGVFFGVAAIVPAWYMMVPNQAALEAMQPPSVQTWYAVATALSEGIDKVPVSARWSMLIGGIIGIVLAITDKYLPPKIKKFTPSAMGLGLSWVMPFSNALAFFIGALVVEIWKRINAKNAEIYYVPVASGAVAGESLVCAMIAIVNAAAALARH